MKRFFGLIAVLMALSAVVWGAEPDINFFSNQPIPEAALVHTPEPKPDWLLYGAPVALLAFFFTFCLIVKLLIPFKETDMHFDLHDLPVAAQRGIGMAVILFGIAFCFGGLEAHYQMTLHGSAEDYFRQMGIGKLIAFTHAHLFGFTTSFFIIGIPFSLHFNRLKLYQWIFPLGLAASLTDVISWWGIKYVSPHFEYVTWWCGFVFGSCYLWMLVGLVRVLFFPRVKWFPDFINEDKQKKWDEERHKK